MKSGKTTLIKSLIKQINKHKISEVVGTITLRAGKSKRITFIECPNDISAMIDLGKIADIALLVIDGSIGFEMETFEFLSIMKSHGFPNVMGVLTHLDFFKDNKQAKKVRKMIKRRFLYEAGDETKLFHISGMKHDLYPKHEVITITYYIFIMLIYLFCFIEFLQLDGQFIQIFENNETKGDSLENQSPIHPD